MEGLLPIGLPHLVVMESLIQKLKHRKIGQISGFYKWVELARGGCVTNQAAQSNLKCNSI